MHKFDEDPILHINPCDMHTRNAEVNICGRPGNTFDIATRGYVMANIECHNVDTESHKDKFDAIEAEISKSTGDITKVIDEFKTTVSALTADLKKQIDDLDTKKQNVITFSTDFDTTGDSLKLNYGEVSDKNEGPVKGSAIVTAFKQIFKDTSYVKSNFTFRNIKDGIISVLEKMGATFSSKSTDGTLDDKTDGVSE